jgi:DNA primase catalytic core
MQTLLTGFSAEAVEMPYVPPEVKERIKREVSIQRLAEARGIKLHRSGRSLMGLCPFHDDRNPSLSIDPVKNEWHCFGCDRKGDVIEWVKCAEGVSFHRALELLKRDYVPSAGPVVKVATVPKLPPLIDPTADDKKLLGVVVDYYNRTLQDSPEAKRYLLKRGLQSGEIIDRFKLGYANRTLCLHLPASNRLAGDAQRARLKALGVIRNQTPGHEHFNGSLVVPVFNLAGDVVEMYGRKIVPNLRTGTDYHTYLPGPHRGVWNEESLIASKDIILCEALIDALTFWVAGYRNVTASYGTNGFTADHRAAFQRHGTERVYIAYDRDEAGDKAAAKLADELTGMGIECFRVQFPRGCDANEYALKTTPAATALGVLLTGAAWMGKGPRPAGRAVVPVIEAEPVAAAAPAVEPLPAEAKSTAKEKKIEEPMPTPTLEPAAEPARESVPAAAASESAQPQERVFSLAVNAVPSAEPAARPMPMSAPTEPKVEVDGDDVKVTIGPRVYQVLWLEKSLARGRMQVNVKVSGANVRGEYRYHGDTFDMESAQRRATFIKQAAYELAVKEEAMHSDVGRLWGILQDKQRERIGKALAPAKKETQKAAWTTSGPDTTQARWAGSCRQTGVQLRRLFLSPILLILSL